MSSTAELICVNPARINEFWPHAKQLIRTAIETTELSEFEDTEREVLSGGQLLWLAWSGQIEAAATTRLSNNVCTIVACSGHNRDRWLPLFAKIEDYAKDEGCRCIRIFGRKGWERVLNDYRVEYVILERQLNGRH